MGNSNRTEGVIVKPVGEYLQNFLRSGTRRKVPIVNNSRCKEVPDRTPDDIYFVAAFCEFIQDFRYEFWELNFHPVNIILQLPRSYEQSNNKVGDSKKRQDKRYCRCASEKPGNQKPKR